MKIINLKELQNRVKTICVTADLILADLQEENVIVADVPEKVKKVRKKRVKKEVVPEPIPEFTKTKRKYQKKAKPFYDESISSQELK